MPTICKSAQRYNDNISICYSTHFLKHAQDNDNETFNMHAKHLSQYCIKVARNYPHAMSENETYIPIAAVFYQLNTVFTVRLRICIPVTGEREEECFSIGMSDDYESALLNAILAMGIHITERPEKFSVDELLLLLGKALYNNDQLFLVRFPY